MRYRATVSYDGTSFEGFQRQAEGHRSVQGELEAALRKIGWQGRSVPGAGRTDRGVHALGQVIAFDIEWRHGEGALLRALNANLPPAVAALDVRETSPDFHPRFSARSRRYRYTIYNSSIRQPLRDRFAWQVWPELSLLPLETATASLIGERDFASFGSAPEPGSHTVRRVRMAHWSHGPPQAGEDGEGWRFDIEAEAFLYQMVRSIVGTLKQVGAGEISPQDFQTILEAKRRDAAGPTAPARGLCLMEVTYE